VVLGNETNIPSQIKMLADTLPVLYQNNGLEASGRLDMTTYADDDPNNDKAIFTPAELLVTEPTEETTTPTEATEPTIDKNACTEPVSVYPSASAAKASEPTECEPDCEECEIPQEPRGARATRFIKKNKKKIAIGLGIAAAVGAAYAIIKAIKGRD
ncbi:MAG: hypothetical protein J6Q72_00140, partial [Clostridia bacterium]|nr:hypothetical protein [Clostridia bacterium]